MDWRIFIPFLYDDVETLVSFGKTCRVLWSFIKDDRVYLRKRAILLHQWTDPILDNTPFVKLRSLPLLRDHLELIIQEGDLALYLRARVRLEGGGSAIGRETIGRETIAYATKYRHLPLIKYLMDHEEKLNWHLAMLFAIKGGHWDMVLFTIDQGANDWPLALMWAAETGRLPWVQFFLDRDPLAHPRDATGWASWAGHTDLAQWLKTVTPNTDRRAPPLQIPSHLFKRQKL